MVEIAVFLYESNLAENQGFLYNKINYGRRGYYAVGF